MLAGGTFCDHGGGFGRSHAYAKDGRPFVLDEQPQVAREADPSPLDTAKPRHAASLVISNGWKTGLAAREDSIMPANLRLVSLVVVAAAVAMPASAQLLARKDLSVAIAKTIAETALASCVEKGFACSVVVVDRSGETVVALRGDNAGPHTLENARRKAYTARSFGQSTTEYAKKFADNDPWFASK
jgi:hypothetical protein